MNAARSADEIFGELIRDFDLPLDESGGGPPPDDVPDFDHGGGGSAWPRWGTHVVAFLWGGITLGFAVLFPPAALILLVLGLAALTLLVAQPTASAWDGPTHLVAFVMGAGVWVSLLLAPIVLPLLALLAVVGFVGLAASRRWR